MAKDWAQPLSPFSAIHAAIAPYNQHNPDCGSSNRSFAFPGGLIGTGRPIYYLDPQYAHTIPDDWNTSCADVVVAKAEVIK